MSDKIKTLQALCHIVEEGKKKGRSFVHCHGVFDLLHPGHIQHLEEAKRLGDELIVSITPDHFVNKGPGRPAFKERLRLLQLAALECVDHVLLNDKSDAIHLIEKLKAQTYVKGNEYREHEKDVTGKIAKEASAIKKVGGKIVYTQGEVFSSSTLLNSYFDEEMERIAPYLKQFKKEHSVEALLEAIQSVEDLKVLIIGDAIIDEYQYVDPLGQSGKGQHLATSLLGKERFLGGALVVANHIASFAKEVTLLTGVGHACPHQALIEGSLASNVRPLYIPTLFESTLVKKRYVLKDGKRLTKLFETYSSNAPLFDDKGTQEVIAALKGEYDLIVAADFGNGFTSQRSIEAIAAKRGFLALNTQINSGNRGYHAATRYPRADYLSLNEAEARLAAREREASIEEVIRRLTRQLSCSSMSMTRGVEGVSFFERGALKSAPALTLQAIDRVGAGDSYFALSSLFTAKGYPLSLAGFLGSIAAAMEVQVVGNREPIAKVPFCKYVTRIMK